jgi:acetyltransferase-like isoleucine patch superfamily enzyme
MELAMKLILKQTAQWLAAIVMLPFTLLFFLLSLLAGKDEAITTFSQLLSLLPGKFGSYLRAGFYRFTLKRCHPTVTIGFGTIFSQADTEIAEHVYIGPQCNIGLCSIGKDTLIGSGVHIMSGKEQHKFTDTELPIRKQGGTFQKVSIGENCWFGNAALVMASTGNGAIVSSGSVVIKEVSEKTIVAGNPAKVIKQRE